MKSIVVVTFVSLLQLIVNSLNDCKQGQWETRFQKLKAKVNEPLFPYARIGGGWYVKGMAYEADTIRNMRRLQERGVEVSEESNKTRPGRRMTTVDSDNDLTTQPSSIYEDMSEQPELDLSKKPNDNTNTLSPVHTTNNIRNNTNNSSSSSELTEVYYQDTVANITEVEKSIQGQTVKTSKHDLGGNDENLLGKSDKMSSKKYTRLQQAQNKNSMIQRKTATFDLQETKKDNRTTLHIIGLFAMTGEYPAGISYLPAALLAIRLINNNASMLPGYRLQLNAHDTRCSEEWALDALYNDLYAQNRKSIITLGSTCSHVTETTAKVSNIWGMVQISYSAVSPHLSNQTIFPSFFRVTTPEQNLTTARVHMIKAMNWTRVHIVYQNYKLFSTLNEYLIKDLKDQNITVVSSNMFTSDPYNSVKRLKEADARIIFGSFYEDMARKVMCAAFNMPDGRKWYKKVVWFIPSFLDRRWTEESHPDCSSSNIKEVIGRYFTIGSIIYNKDPSYQAVGNFSHELFQEYNLYKEVKDVIPKEFSDRYTSCTSSKDCSLYAMHRSSEAFDAVWTIALALKNTLAYLKDRGDERGLGDFDYGKNHTDLPCIIREAMQNVTFQALSGPFHFNSKGEGTSEIQIIRYNNSGNYKFTRVGNCSHNHQDQWNCFIQKDVIYWETVNGKPPFDGIQTRLRHIVIELCVMIIIFSLAGVGIMTSLCLLVFNIWNRNHRIIKMSSPSLNNLILVGSAMGYLDVTLQDNGVKPQVSTCMIRLFILPLGFCLVFGSLFAKTWRVYEIFTAGAQAHKLNKKILRDSSLLLIVAALVAINWVITGIWMVVSPQNAVTSEISNTEVEERSDLDIQYVNYFHHCDSRLETEFTIVLAAVNGLVLIFGTFLAVQTRKVSYPEFNDSRMIAMAIYNFVVVYPVSKVMDYALQDKPELRYKLQSIVQMTMCSVTLSLIFVPKLISYRRHNKQSTDAQQHQMTYNIQCVNTSLDAVVVETGKSRSSVRSRSQTSPDCGRRMTGKNITHKASINNAYQSDEDSHIGENFTRGEISKVDEVTEFGNDLETDKNRKSTFLGWEQNKVVIENFGSKRKFGSVHSWFSMKYPQILPLRHKIEESPKQTGRDPSCCLKRSLSDTNLGFIIYEEERNEKERDKESYLDENHLDKNERMKEKQDKSSDRRQIFGNLSSIFHDDTVMQHIKLKTGVKVIARTGVSRKATVGFKASWKQESNVAQMKIKSIKAEAKL